MVPLSGQKIGNRAHSAGEWLRRYAVPVWDRIPTVLSFALLAVQIVTPWAVRNFITQDGPSHLYGATIFRELVFDHGRSIYSPLYTIQRAAIPNWMSTIALAICSKLAGTAHAEKLFASLAIGAGFFAFAFAVRSLWPEGRPWSPIANFLLQVWFLWMGFYNFYLGMALLPLAIAFYLRWRGTLTWLRALALSAILVLMFLTHIVPAILAIIAVASLALWRAVWEPQRRARGILMTAAAAAPVVLLIGVYAHNAGQRVPYVPQAIWAWHQFPMHVFQTAPGEIGAQQNTWRFLLAYALVAVLLMKRSEWRSPRGGLTIAAILAFLMYLCAPDLGFGGGEVKIRLAWAVFVLAGLVACSVSRLRPLRPLAALCIAGWMVPNLLATYRTAKLISTAGEDYMTAAGAMPAQSSFVRLRYASPGLSNRFGYAGIGRDPLFHLDAFAAVQKHGTDLSDYEPLNPIFPVIYKKTAVHADQQSGLWAFEGPDPGSLETLVWLYGGLPRPFDYVLVLGELSAPDAIRAGMPAMIEYLNANMTPIANSPSGAVRLYRCNRPLPWPK